jgi:mannitol/fructose-specific phosphotransferase system IIA component (Ntr-type)
MDAPSIGILILRTPNRRETTDALLIHLIEEGTLSLDDAAEIRDGLERRHELGAFTLGGGIAVPHLKHASVARYFVTFALLTTPNAGWESIDGEPVDLIFLILAPYEQTIMYRGFFERLYRRLRDGLAEKLRRCTTAEELAALLSNDLDG